jgi:Flp pilus assembly protein TadG
MCDAFSATQPRGRCSRRSLLRSFLRGRRGERGVTLIEFAIVAVPFFFLVFGTMELGLVLWGTYELENATEDAARMIRTGQVHSQYIGESGFKTLVCERVVLLSQCQTRLRLDVRSYGSFSAIGNDNFQPLDPTSKELGTAFQWQATQPRAIVVVRTFYPWPLFMGLTSAVLSNMAGGDRLLWATAVFRNEGWPL